MTGTPLVDDWHTPCALQLPHMPSPAPTCPPHPPNQQAVARQVYAEYGLPGFWNGTAASLIMVVNPTLQVGRAGGGAWLCG